MARGRMLSRDAGSDPNLNALSLEAELLYLLAIAHLDRDGLIAGDPVLVWANAAPKRIELLEKAPKLVNEWVERGLVIRYEWRDGPILFFKGFRKHNASMVYEREPESKYPPPPGWYRSKAGLIPDDEDVAMQLAQDFDSRSGYHKALASGGGVETRSSQERTAKTVESSREVHEDFVRDSGKHRAEHQDQDQHQHQSYDDDEGGPVATTDDDVVSSLMDERHEEHSEMSACHVGHARGVRAAMEELAICWAASLRGWTGAERTITKLNDSQLMAMLSWLYLWQMLNEDDAHIQLYAVDRYGDVFDGVKNPVGKIITQARLGNLAPLVDVDRFDLKEVMREEMGEVTDEEILFGG